MDVWLGLLLIVLPLAVIVASVVGFRLFGPGRSSNATVASSAPREIDQVRLDLAHSIASGMLSQQEAPDRQTLAELLFLKDSRKPAHAVKLLRERTGLSLTEARRVLARLP